MISFISSKGVKRKIRVHRDWICTQILHNGFRLSNDCYTKGYSDGITTNFSSTLLKYHLMV